jgi:hypothetical protein
MSIIKREKSSMGAQFRGKHVFKSWQMSSRGRTFWERKEVWENHSVQDKRKSSLSKFVRGKQKAHVLFWQLTGGQYELKELMSKFNIMRNIWLMFVQSAAWIHSFPSKVFWNVSFQLPLLVPSASFCTWHDYNVRPLWLSTELCN